jgi:uncharacterized protein with von Willebrand factor type A (vWA) domain
LTDTALRVLPRVGAHTDLQRNILAFCRILRDRELLVSSSEVIAAEESAHLIDLSDRDEFKLALRGILTSRPEDLAVFDTAFEQFWRTRPIEGGDDHFSTRERAKLGRGQELPLTAQLDGVAGPPLKDNVSAPVSSPIEVLTERNFASFEADELIAMKRVVREMARRLATQESRRYRASRRGSRVDLRRTMRRSLQFGGTPVQLSYKRQAIRKQRIVLICDVSRSMETYSAFLLQFVYALQHVLGRVESFVFSTRLTRVTEYFKSSTIQLALARMAHEVPDWGGGTRMGDSLHAFNRDWARRVLNPRTVVLILSDGIDSGHWSVLEREVSEIELRSRRLIWLNPLLGNSDYRPTARGLRASLPHVSLFASAHNLDSLRTLADSLVGGPS